MVAPGPNVTAVDSNVEGKTPELGTPCFVAEDARVIGDVRIGNGSSVWWGSTIRGDVHHIRIGEYTNIQDMCMIHVTGGKFPTVIGNHCTLGHIVYIGELYKKGLLSERIMHECVIRLSNSHRDV